MPTGDVKESAGSCLEKCSDSLEYNESTSWPKPDQSRSMNRCPTSPSRVIGSSPGDPADRPTSGLRTQTEPLPGLEQVHRARLRGVPAGSAQESFIWSPAWWITHRNESRAHHRRSERGGGPGPRHRLRRRNRWQCSGQRAARQGPMGDIGESTHASNANDQRLWIILTRSSRL
jgi:hypothetical protein